MLEAAKGFSPSFRKKSRRDRCDEIVWYRTRVVSEVVRFCCQILNGRGRIGHVNGWLPPWWPSFCPPASMVTSADRQTSRPLLVLLSCGVEAFLATPTDRTTVEQLQAGRDWAMDWNGSPWGSERINRRSSDPPFAGSDTTSKAFQSQRVTSANWFRSFCAQY